MMEQIAHRGGNHTKTVASPQATMLSSWAEIETRTVSTVLEQTAVWDGVPIRSPAPGALDGWTQPCALAAVSPRGVFLARGPLGVKPLYYGHMADGALAFASEVKALLAVTHDVNEFPPGTWYTPRDGFTPYARLAGGSLPPNDAERSAVGVREGLDRAVARCVVADEMGTWLSGGVDSSVIATLARPRVRVLHSFVSGVKGSPDLDYGRQMASFLATVHHSLIVTARDMMRALPEVIRHLESFDALLVRSSVVNYLTAKLASDYVSSVLSGEGGDELFAGYDYIKGLPLDEVPAELADIVMRLHNTALQRVDRCASAHGLVAHVPFADLDVVRHALGIPAELKIRSHSGALTEKWILRHAFQGSVPDTVLWRPKAKFWQGAGVDELMADHARAAITDGDFRRERTLPNGWHLNSKEELFYYRIFREHFGEVADLNWMGRTKTPPTS